MQAVSPDAQYGFVGRLSRYPSLGQTWLWGHAFLPGRVFAYTDDSLPCGPGVTDTTAPGTTYVNAEPHAEFRRAGAREAMTGATLSLRVPAHEDPHAPGGPGPVPLRVEATFRADRRTGGSLPGRMEVLGEVEWTLEVAGERLEMTTAGHWHEQHQEAQRFVVPFTYVSLRGRDLSFVAILARRGASGFAYRGDAIVSIESFEIEPRAPRRAFTIVLADGTLVAGHVDRVHDYSVPIYHHRRPGSQVAGLANGEPVAGTVNDWAPGRDDGNWR
jgi:hypothetical protein